MLASFLVVTFNSRDELPACFRSLSALATHDYEILVVDNASTDGSADLVRRDYPQATVLRSGTNLGFGGAVNLGSRQSAGDVIVVLNPDIELAPGWLRESTDALLRDPGVGIVGSKLLYPDGRTIQHAGGLITYPLALTNHYGYGEADRGQYDEVREVEYVTGAAFAVKKSVLEGIGYFDEGFYPAYFEETDLCFRARKAGYKVLYVPSAVAIHLESATTGTATSQYFRLYHRNRVRYVLKHYSDEQLWQDFLPAELERTQGIVDGVEATALRRAYQDNREILEGHASLFANPAGVAPLPTSGNRSRLLIILERLSDRTRLHPPGTGTQLAFDSKGIADGVSTLAAKRHITEVPFTSGAPIVGPLIIKIRQLWNWMSTAWYVRPLIQQQNDFNTVAAEVLGTMASAIENTQGAIMGLDQRASTLEALSRELDLTVRAIEPTVGTADQSLVHTNAEIARLDGRLRHIEDYLVNRQASIDVSPPPTSKAEL
jgi:GT2 family glycosyltransferase